MRTITSVLLLFGILISFQGCVPPLCGCSPPPPEVHDFLQGDWSANEVILDGNNLNSDWLDFEVKFSSENFVTSNSENLKIWPESGYYNLSENMVIERGDSVRMTIDFISESELQLSFSETSTGSWMFSFDRKF